MNKYDVYNAVHVVKNWFRSPVALRPGENSAADARLIRDLSRCELVYARDQHRYFYCIPYDVTNIDVLGYLLRRNGVSVVPYQSRYQNDVDGRRSVLRVRTRALDKMPVVREYVDNLVHSMRSSDLSGLDACVALVRAQMGKSK